MELREAVLNYIKKNPGVDYLDIVSQFGRDYLNSVVSAAIDQLKEDGIIVQKQRRGSTLMPGYFTVNRSIETAFSQV